MAFETTVRENGFNIEIEVNLTRNGISCRFGVGFKATYNNNSSDQEAGNDDSGLSHGGG
jgi:hypothetical protein